MESVLLAALFTIIEAGGLLILIYFGFTSEYVSFDQIGEVFTPNFDTALVLGLINAAMLAVFAFIGFEDMVNVAEETKRPRKTMPLAIFLTLAITTVLYTLVTLVAVLSVGPEVIGDSNAPLSLVFEKVTGASPRYLSVIAIFATANTILVQFIMVSRVMYGMAEQGNFPKLFHRLNRTTQTPILATIAVVIVTLLLAIAFPLDRLAEVTSQIILVIWILADIALILIKLRKEVPEKGGYIAPMWVPIIGAVFCAVLLVLSFVA